VKGDPAYAHARQLKTPRRVGVDPEAGGHRLIAVFAFSRQRLSGTTSNENAANFHGRSLS